MEGKEWRKDLTEESSTISRIYEQIIFYGLERGAAKKSVSKELAREWA
jgi:hypothetical protein